MEIFCRNVPEQVQDNHLTKQIRPILAHFSINTFECRKVGRRNATLTIADIKKAQRLLDTHGQPQDRKRGPHRKLILFGFPIYLEKSLKEPPDMLIQALREEEESKRNAARPRAGPRSNAGDIKKVRRFSIIMMSCGVWDYQQNNPVFVEHFRLQHRGSIYLGKTKISVSLTDITRSATYYVEIPYWNIFDNIYLGTLQLPSVTVTTEYAPRFHISDATEQLKVQMAKLLNKNARIPPEKRRVSYLLPEHEKIAGRCFIYRFVLENSNDIHQVRNLGGDRQVPKMIRWTDCRVSPRMPYAVLEKEFEKYLNSAPVSYRAKFQLQKLVWNGTLSLGRASLLYQVIIQRLNSSHTSDTIAQALMRLSRDLQFPSPSVPPKDVGMKTITEALSSNIESITLEGGSMDDYVHPNSVLVHRAQVTPCGIYLCGPYPEANNRVLRKYSEYIDYFIRVEFTDESGDRIFFDPHSSLEQIYQRFANVLKRGIEIGGRVFTFLGFSHSSLRSQTCWFCAPFVTVEGEVLNARLIIDRLGEFDQILSPSKQAARIGQAFTDTLTSISVYPEELRMRAPDVERNGRVFSDGVGIISPGLMYRVWNEYALTQKVKPTVLQIRIAGAKGMVSLDSRVKGELLMLRNSMVKFPTEDSYNIEICGAGIRALPFYLNVQIIKLLEDLGVPFEAFRQLQDDEIKSLHAAFRSTAQAVKFVESSHISKSARIPCLLQVLKGFGVHYSQDPFLHQVMKLTGLLKLRDLKYRARIRVPNAITLYGIMDETGFLKENEIFCVYLTEQGYREILVRKNIVITRSPALHPGDIRIVDAVDVPKNSPLRKLHNCVAFSQHGERDLPSMLSGGDLDGDLYNIIYDERLLPMGTYPPADYPLVKALELDRKVVVNDIIDFFVTFMQQDQLGRIATTHQTFADISPNGTFNENCLSLAQLHSTAVDYSKSGIPVNVMRIPRGPRYRPDFMAPSPRIQIADSIEILTDKSDMMIDDSDDEEEDRPALRYYKSQKILGRLYRSVDEGSFLQQLRNVGLTENRGGAKALQKVWNYIDQETSGFQWNHLVGICSDIREIYEDNVRDLMHQYSPTPWKSSISEYEVFAGTVLGNGGKQNSRARENSKDMRERYDAIVNSTVSMIRESDQGDIESLERSIACFWASINEDSFPQKISVRNPTQDKLLSFPWIAAVTCLREVDMFQRSVGF